jgi:tetratricopeptide (TPR) repeat protein
MDSLDISNRNAVSSAGGAWPSARITGVAVVGIVFAVFCRCISFDFVGWDDALFIASNPRFNPPTWQTVVYYWRHPGFNLYMPVSYSLWAAAATLAYLPTPDAAGNHLNPFIFHMLGLFCHLVSTAAVYGILLVVLRSVSASAVGALAFGIHPLMTESVVFIGTMNTVIAAAFGLSAVWLYLTRSDSAAGRGRWIFATVLYGLSLLAKPTTVTVPLLAVCLEIVALHRPVRRAIPCVTPWILITVPCLIWTKVIQSGAGTQAAPLWARPWIASDAVAFYLAKIAWPAPLTIDYGRTPAWVLAHPHTAILVVIPAALLLLAWMIRRHRPILAIALVLYLVMLLPNSGLVSFEYQRVSNVADRYTYLAMVAAALAIGSVLSRLRGGVTRRSAYSAMFAVLICWAVATNLQLSSWRNGVTLFSHAVSVNPQSFYSWQCLAQADLRNDDASGALLAATRSIALNPVNEEFRSAVSARRSDPVTPPTGSASAWAEAAQAHVARANALDRLNRLRDAASELDIAVQMNPGNVIAITNLAFVLGRLGDDSHAQTLLRRALQIDPAFAPARAALRQPTHAEGK